MFDPHDFRLDRATLIEAARKTPLVAALSLAAGCLSGVWLSTALGVWPLWLPAGVAVFAVLHWGKITLPGVWLGSFLAFWLLAPFEGHGAALAFGLACIATLSALTLVIAASRWPLAWREKTDVLRFVSVAGLLPGLVTALLHAVLFGVLEINVWSAVPFAMLRGWSSDVGASLLGAMIAAAFVSPKMLRRVAVPFAAITLAACWFASGNTSWLAAAFPLLLGTSAAIALLLAHRPDAEPLVARSAPPVRILRDEAEVRRLGALLQDRDQAAQRSEAAWARREAEWGKARDKLQFEHDQALAELRGSIEAARQQASDLQRLQQDGEQRMIQYQQLENEARQREGALRLQVQESLDRAAALERRERETQAQRAALEAQLAEWRRRAGEVEQRLRELQEQRDATLRHRNQLQESEGQLRSQLEERQASFARLEAELRQRGDAHSVEKARIERALAESQQEQQRQQSEIARIERALAESQQELQRRQADLARLQAELRQQREWKDHHESRFERTIAQSHDEKMQAAQRVVGQIAHDLANPLCAMLGTIDLLGRQWDLPDEFRQALGRVRDAGQAATAKLASLQALQGNVAQSAQRVDLRELAKSVRASKPGVRVECAVDQPSWVEGDGDQLKRVAQHLLDNAAEATQADGVVRVSAGVEGGRAFLRVEDDGPGMDEATRRRCTEPFYTSKSDGHRGVGLAECWAIAQRHGGRLDIDSAPGRGTRVTLWLANRTEEVTIPRKRSA
jgi:signal transduction histidine kinase